MFDNKEFRDIACVQQVVDDILEEVNKGHVKGIMYQILFDDDWHQTGSTNNLLYIEKLGLLESAKMDVHAKIREVTTKNIDIDGNILDGDDDKAGE